MARINKLQFLIHVDSVDEIITQAIVNALYQLRSDLSVEGIEKPDGAYLRFNNNNSINIPMLLAALEHITKIVEDTTINIKCIHLAKLRIISEHDIIDGKLIEHDVNTYKYDYDYYVSILPHIPYKYLCALYLSTFSTLEQYTDVMITYGADDDLTFSALVFILKSDDLIRNVFNDTKPSKKMIEYLLKFSNEYNLGNLDFLLDYHLETVEKINLDN